MPSASRCWGPSIAGRATWSGSEFFDIVQPTLFSLIWLFAPIMTCDSISRERREGTLGLLLLTLLRPMDVGLAKACSGILRSLSVVLAVLPMLAIALLLGGVSRTELLRAGLMDAMALLAAIARGVAGFEPLPEFQPGGHPGAGISPPWRC